jgi:hypothetical protein
MLHEVGRDGKNRYRPSKVRPKEDCIKDNSEECN